MIRSFRELMELLGSAPAQEKEPDLFDYAQKQIPPDEKGGMPADESAQKRRKALLTLLLSMYPLLFGAGYLTHSAVSDCSELEAALGMIPDLAGKDEESTDGSGINVTPDQRRFLGAYNAEVSGHKASMYIYALKTGGVGGYLRFKNWGRREIEYMKNLRIHSNRIEFIRSCRGKECVRIGSPSPIYQVYSGNLGENGISIEGTYTGGQSASAWTAEKIR